MTNPDHARFAEWDAAYVLGALSPSDRREFEDHLEDCDRCRASVSELSALPGLLGRIDDARAFALLEDTDVIESTDADEAVQAPTSTDTVTRIRDFERRRKLKRTLFSIGGLAAAAALASALTIAIPTYLNQPKIPDAVVGLSSTDGQAIPIDVIVRMTKVDWGTKLEMDCIYHPGGDVANSYGPTSYSLWVVDADGTERSVSTWKSSPGTDVRLEAGTASTLDEISQLELRTADGGQTLMDADVGS